MTTRYTKIAMILALAAFAFLTVFNNITDYRSNFNFVQHVLSMDTTLPTMPPGIAPSINRGCGTVLIG
jgi:predicted small integral membrane protein